MSTAPNTTLAPNGVASISNYQVITPTCWNASPKDTSGVRGPIEQALMGTPVAVAAQPVEVLRVVHSFDPCMSCAVHVMRPDGKPVTIINAQAEF
jgi:hydrogenase large subunit